MSHQVISKRLPWWVPWLATALLLALIAFFWLHPFLAARWELSRIGKLDEDTLSMAEIIIDLNTFDHDVPEWCTFHLKESTLTMLQARYGHAAIKHYQSVRVEGPWCDVVSVTDPSHRSHHFKLSAGRGNDSVLYRLEHLPRPYDSSGMTLMPSY